MFGLDRAGFLIRRINRYFQSFSFYSSAFPFLYSLLCSALYVLVRVLPLLLLILLSTPSFKHTVDEAICLSRRVANSTKESVKRVAVSTVSFFVRSPRVQSAFFQGLRGDIFMFMVFVNVVVLTALLTGLIVYYGF